MIHRSWKIRGIIMIYHGGLWLWYHHLYGNLIETIPNFSHELQTWVESYRLPWRYLAQARTICCFAGCVDITLFAVQSSHEI